MTEILLVMGYPASGKSTWAREHVGERGVLLDRDGERASLSDLSPGVARGVASGASRIVLANGYPTVASRRPVLEVARAHALAVRCVQIDTSIEQARVNAAERILARYGRLLGPDEIREVGARDYSVFSPAALLRYRRLLEAPTVAEGFRTVETARFERRARVGGSGKALLLDYDGTLRRTRSGAKYPTSPDDVEVLPRRREVLARYRRAGWRLLGVSNQGDVARGRLDAQDAIDCFDRTNALLEVEIEVAFCPHEPAPIRCYCRKPMPGLGVAFLLKHRLDPAHTVMVGDLATDRSFADGLGIRYADAEAFFGPSA